MHTHPRGILAEVLRHLLGDELPPGVGQAWPGVELRLLQPPVPGCRVVQIQYDSMKFVLLYGLEALAFLVGAAYCGSRIRHGLWALLGLLGGFLGGAVALLYAVGWAQLQWADTSGVFDLMSRSTLLTQSDWARPVATALLVAGIVAGTRGSRRPGRRPGTGA